MVVIIIFWKGKMKELLFVKNIHLPIFATLKPKSKIEEEWEFEHQQVCGFIRQWVEDNVYNHIANESNAKNLSGMGIKFKDEVQGF